MQSPSNTHGEPPVAMVDHGARALLAIVASLLAGCVWGGIVLVLLFIVPKYEDIYRDFGVSLPRGVVLSIQTANWLGGRGAGQSVPGLLIAGPILFGLIATLGAMCVQRRTRTIATLLLFLLGTAGVALFAAGFASFHTALLSMTEALQGGKL